MNAKKKKRIYTTVALKIQLNHMTVYKRRLKSFQSTSEKIIPNLL